MRRVKKILLLMKKLTEANARSFTIALIIVTFFIRLLIAAYTTGLGNGESYYFRGALHLEWSYSFDQPPCFFAG